MESVLRGLLVYMFLMIVLRGSGKRALSEATVFDFVLILIVGEATQQALLGDDFSVINACIVITTLIGLDRIFGFLKQKSKRIDALLDGKPTILMSNGEVLEEHLKWAHMDMDDILEAARKIHGIANHKDIHTAILERDGEISIIPYSSVRSN